MEWGGGPAAGFSYVLPLRMTDAGARDELTAYLRTVADWCDDVIVVDGSAPEIFAGNRHAWSALGRHVAPDPMHASLMGKVSGVLTGIDLAQHERIIIADDDVRYDRGALSRVVALLGRYDLVRPQNYFSALPWHARWDTARTLLNRATGADFPGTLGVRRSMVRAAGGYDGNVLFENLELIRTIEAQGGEVISPLDLFVARQPPTAAHFWGQRTRQAYDDFAIPARMAVWLSIVPILGVCAARRAPRGALVAAVASVALAERGRRRGAGTSRFEWSSSLLAPLWLLERGVTAWLAVLQRLRYGGVRYGDSVIAVAAHSKRRLRQRAMASRNRPVRATGRDGNVMPAGGAARAMTGGLQCGCNLRSAQNSPQAGRVSRGWRLWDAPRAKP